jgi:phosphoglycolate phosphatase
VHIFFDFDGTLADSSEGIYGAFVHACEEVGISAPGLSEFRSCIGPPIQILARQLLPGIESDRLEALCLRFRSEYDQNCYTRLLWYEGAIEGLRRLRTLESTRISVVTNKPTQPTNNLVASAGISDLFDYVIGVDYRIANKSGAVFGSKKDAISYALALTQCPVKQAVYVGDTLSDQKASQDCGVAFIAAIYGFYSWQKHELKGATVAGSFEEIVECLYLMSSRLR